jgi:hypothetical protein
LVTISGFSHAAETDESNEPYTGLVRFRYDNFFVDKDAGRFREDQWRKDDQSWGLDWLHIESKEPDVHGYEWIFESRAMYDYDYRMSLLMKKEDSHYLKLDFKGLRRYYDGSNEYWDQGLYGLPSADGRAVSEHRDGDFFIDRRDYNIELGLTPPDGLEVILGWHRMERDGKEALLRGSRARVTGDTVPRFEGIPAISNVKGVTDTFYANIMCG